MDQEFIDVLLVRLHQVKEVLEQVRSTKLERKFALLHVETMIDLVEKEEAR